MSAAATRKKLPPQRMERQLGAHEWLNRAAVSKKAAP
jgi:hypothetical protein